MPYAITPARDNAMHRPQRAELDVNTMPGAMGAIYAELLADAEQDA